AQRFAVIGTSFNGDKTVCKTGFLPAYIAQQQAAPGPGEPRRCTITACGKAMVTGPTGVSHGFPVWMETGIGKGATGALCPLQRHGRIEELRLYAMSGNSVTAANGGTTIFDQMQHEGWLGEPRVLKTAVVGEHAGTEPEMPTREPLSVAQRGVRGSA